MYYSNVTPNVSTPFIPRVKKPRIDKSAYVHPAASVIGDVTIGREVMVAPMVSIRADEGAPFFIGDEANVQDGAVLHGLHTWEDGGDVPANMKIVNGKSYSIYIGSRVSLAHLCHIHGPVAIMDDTFIGMQALILMTTVGRNCVIEPGCKIMGVDIPAHRYVPLGSIIASQSEADNLPRITEDYPMKDLNKGVVAVNTQLARAYRNRG